MADFKRFGAKKKGVREVSDAQMKPEDFTRELYPVLRCIARRYLPATSAEDAVQEALSRFWSAWNNGLVIERWEAYLIGILKNVIKEIKRDQRRYSQELDETSEQMLTQEELFQQHEEQAIVRRCFARLSANCQKLLYLHIIEDRSFNELEQMLKKSHSTLHRWCRKNLKHFSQELKKNEINCGQ